MDGPQVELEVQLSLVMEVALSAWKWSEAVVNGQGWLADAQQRVQMRSNLEQLG